MHTYLLNLLSLIIWKFNVFKYNSNDQVNTYVCSKDEIKHKYKWWYPPVTQSTLSLWQTSSHYGKWQVWKKIICSFNHLQIEIFDDRLFKNNLRPINLHYDFVNVLEFSKKLPICYPRSHSIPHLIHPTFSSGDTKPSQHGW
jgi:hypothetical protein